MTEQASPHFLYCLDDTVFTTPWGRPSMLQLECWFREMRQRFDSFCGYTPYLFGGFWSSTGHKTWDVDVFLVNADPQSNESLRSKELLALGALHDLISEGIALAITKFRFLVDMTVTSHQHLSAVAGLFRQFEKGKIEELKYPKHLESMDTGYGIHRTVRKVRNGKEVVSITKDVANIIELDERRRFYKKIGHNLNKQARRIRAGRIHYPPTQLDELFS